MKKLLLLFSLLVSSYCKASYHDKTVYLRANGGTFTIFRSITYDEANKPIDTVYSFMAMEKFPPYSQKPVKKELYYGSLNEVYSFLIDVKDKFATAEHRGEYLIDGMQATYSEQTFITHFIIENCSVQITLVNKLISRMKAKCLQENIQLKYVKRKSINILNPRFSDLIKVDTSISYKELHGQLLEWIAESWPKPKDVLQIDDVANGYMCIVGTMPVHTGSVFNIYEPVQFFRYKIKIWHLDGNISYEINQIFVVTKWNDREYSLDIYTKQASNGSRKHQDIVKACYNHLNDLIITLNQQMKK